MFCAFEGDPNIVRLYGTGHAVLPGNPEWDELIGLFPVYPGTRQLIVADITRVQTSCGYSVPFYDYQGERETYFRWVESKGGESALAEYREEKNRRSIDALPTPLAVRKPDA